MTAVSHVLKDTILKLQQLKSLSKFSLAGGTNLALRYDHRISVDIDLFCEEIIGIKGFQEIKKEVSDAFKGKVLSALFPCEINDQFVFLRMFLIVSGETVKVEMLQNMKNLYPNEIFEGIRLISLRDLGVFKLISASNRFAKKDIYDLDYITDKIALKLLIEDLKWKETKYNTNEYRTIFDLDGYSSCVQNPALLLMFDNVYLVDKDKPIHSNDVISITDKGRKWNSVRFSWRQKVKKVDS